MPKLIGIIYKILLFSDPDSNLTSKLRSGFEKNESGSEKLLLCTIFFRLLKKINQLQYYRRTGYSGKSGFKSSVMSTLGSVTVCIVYHLYSLLFVASTVPFVVSTICGVYLLKCLPSAQNSIYIGYCLFRLYGQSSIGPVIPLYTVLSLYCCPSVHSAVCTVCYLYRTFYSIGLYTVQSSVRIVCCLYSHTSVQWTIRTVDHQYRHPSVHKWSISVH